MRVVKFWILLGLVLAPGCGFWKSNSIAPTHQLRPDAEGVQPLGLDDRSRQIESNLGIR